MSFKLKVLKQCISKLEVKNSELKARVTLQNF